MTPVPPSNRRVVVTGLGLITPCGQGWAPYWKAVLDGQSSIRHLTSLSLNGFPVKLAGEIRDFDPARYVKQKKSLKLMSREIQLAIAASQLALEDAGLVLSENDRERFGISIGTGIINNDLDEVGIGIRNGFDENGQFSMTKFGQDGIRALYPLWLLKYLPNMPACHISIAHGLRGPSNTVTTSAAAGAQAIGEAFRIIERGDADLMLAGGTDSKINAMGISRFNLLNLLSHRNHVPGKTYCPFDRLHDGIILGEGAGLVVLEELEHAKKRGASIYGELTGYGSSSDFNYDPRMSEDFTGKRMAMTRAMDDAGVEDEDIDFLFANGSGIPQEDVQEASAVRHVFGKSLDRLRVTATKPITGHLIYGAGGVEMAAALLALKENVIPPLVNLENPDPDCNLPFVTEAPETRKVRAFLFNSFGFGGQNASLVVKKL